MIPDLYVSNSLVSGTGTLYDIDEIISIHFSRNTSFSSYLEVKRDFHSVSSELSSLSFTNRLRPSFSFIDNSSTKTPF